MNEQLLAVIKQCEAFVTRDTEKIVITLVDGWATVKIQSNYLVEVEYSVLVYDNLAPFLNIHNAFKTVENLRHEARNQGYNVAEQMSNNLSYYFEVSN